MRGEAFRKNMNIKKYLIIHTQKLNITGSHFNLISDIELPHKTVTSI